MSAPYPVDLYPGCPCYACDSPTWPLFTDHEGRKRAQVERMSLCPRCGSKRCEGAVNHRRNCTETPSSTDRSKT